MARAHADLHTHSALSDGTDSPTDLVRLADELKLGGIALTDHDTIMGLREFMEARASSDLQRVPGLELSADFGDQEVHIIGYFVPLESKKLDSKLGDLRKRRRYKLSKIVDKLHNLGIELEQDEIEETLRGVESPGRPHLAALLVKKGIVATTDEAFEQYLGEGRPAYVEKKRMHVFDAIGLLRSVGAVPVIAHPLTVDVPDLGEFLETLAKAGVSGVEVEYDYQPVKIDANLEELRRVTQELNLIETGGSDYHGDSWMGALGSITVPIETIEILREAADAQNTQA
ncbi:MAG: PHP domain-containing protein [Candidatus Thorarchaeota archaeon]|jgi:predicted metal-dependent phosphoesterase TrpH